MIITIAAKPGEGKTSQLIKFGIQEYHEGKKGLFLSFEETVSSIMKRFTVLNDIITPRINLNSEFVSQPIDSNFRLSEFKLDKKFDVLIIDSPLCSTGIENLLIYNHLEKVYVSKQLKRSNI